MARTDNVLVTTFADGPARFIVKSASVIYVGSHVCEETATGKIKPFVTGAGVRYLGIAQEKKTGNAGGTIDCLVDISGPVLRKTAVVGVSAQTHVGDLVYLSDDATLTISQPDANTSAVGYIRYWYSSTSCDVKLFSANDIQVFENADVAAGPYTSPSFATSFILDQTTGDYTVTWADPATDRAISFEDPLGTDVIAYKAAAQTLSNKTLTAPKIVTTGYIADAGGDEYLVFTESATPVTYIGITQGDTGVAPRVQGAGETNTDLHLLGSGTGNVFISDGTDPTKDLNFELSGATTAKTMTFTSSHTDDRTLTFPDATDTLVGKATTDTLTNKTLTAPSVGTTLTMVEAANIVLGTTTGTKIGTAAAQKLGFYNATPVVQAAVPAADLTALTNAGTPSDYAIQAMTNSSPFGFVTQAEGETVVQVVLNNQLQLSEIRACLVNLGLMASA